MMDIIHGQNKAAFPSSGTLLVYTRSDPDESERIRLFLTLGCSEIVRYSENTSGAAEDLLRFFNGFISENVSLVIVAGGSGSSALTGIDPNAFHRSVFGPGPYRLAAQNHAETLAVLFPDSVMRDLGAAVAADIGGARVYGPFFPVMAKPMGLVPPDGTPDDLLQTAVLTAVLAQKKLDGTGPKNSRPQTAEIF